ncbi:MAG: site-2 protease family protein [Planctomycetia bacterium]|nr:site-2 protease family protein [Planctomycetia bacterium]
MFLVEPPRTQYDLNFSVAGVPVRVHPLFWLITLLLGASGNPDPVAVLLWVIAVFVSILVHELGHVLAFAYYGTRAHVVLHSMGGLAIPDGSAANWSGVPRRRRDWISDVVIAFAGPAAGFVLAATLFAALAVAGRAPKMIVNNTTLLDPTWKPLPSPYVNLLLSYAMFINIFWGLVNLLPIFPLDGGQISRAVITRFNPDQGLRQSLILSIVAAVAVAIFMFVRLHDQFLALFFAFMAYNSYMLFQQISGGGYGGRW